MKENFDVESTAADAIIRFIKAANLCVKGKIYTEDRIHSCIATSQKTASKAESDHRSP